LFGKIKSFLKDISESFKKEAGSTIVYDRSVEIDAIVSDVVLPRINEIVYRNPDDLSILVTLCDLSERSEAQISIDGFDDTSCTVNIANSENSEIETRSNIFGLALLGSEANIFSFQLESVPISILEESIRAFESRKAAVTDFELFGIPFLKVTDIFLIDSPELYTETFYTKLKIDTSDSIIARFPIRRKAIGGSLYSSESIKNALLFVLERIEHKPILRSIGIFKDVPINRIKQLTFEKNELSFTLNSLNRRNLHVLDVLVVFDETKEKYHIAPIIRG
jgi:hypothetical protein